MSLVQIAILGIAAILCSFLGRWRTWGLLVCSLLGIFWLQTASSIRFLDFWSAAASIGLVTWAWFAIQSGTTNDDRETWKKALPGMLTAGGIILALDATRYLHLGYGTPPFNLLTSRPPVMPQVITAIFFLMALVASMVHWPDARRAGLVGAGLLVLAVFILLKTEPIATSASAFLRHINGQQTSLANALDIRWVGFSYLAFRLLHIVQDQRARRLPVLTFPELLVYALFFPAITAGPIDRVQRFIQDLRKPFQPNAQNSLAAGQRIAAGIFKKFILADTLALAALNPTNALQIQNGAGWAWVVLYAYALRIYFDFSGYTDVAIGLGMLSGIRMPENFDRPYSKTNLTAFWNSWHITLAQWFRAYFFNPLTRSLRGRKRLWPMPAIIFCGQVGTMLLIGLWHGVSWNFIIWGAWHGVGLFLHSRWAEWLKPRAHLLEQNRWLAQAWSTAGWLLTFHFVTLGWVWFVLPDLHSAEFMFSRLFGF